MLRRVPQRLLRSLCLVALLSAGKLSAQDGMDDDYGPQPTRSAEATNRFEAAVKLHAKDADMLVLPGLLADRKERTVEVLAECTGLGPGEAAEFLLIDTGSSHGYEALLWSHAKPSDIHRALQFIGARSGAPVNPAMMRFWSTGDRIALNVRSDEGDGEVPIEELIMDNETGETLPEEGFVFAGSLMVPMPGEEGGNRYAADYYDPRTVAALFNDPAAVLDVPRQVNQGEAYGSHVISDDAAFEHGTLLTIVMTPMNVDGESGVRRLTLRVEQPAGSTNLLCRLSDTSGKVLAEAAALSGVLEPLAGSKQGDTVPEITMSFGDGVTVRNMRASAGLMRVVESLSIARIGPPAEGRLYYAAFLPDERWRQAEGRPSQPWELHLRQEDEAVVAELVIHKETWVEGKLSPNLERMVFPVAKPSAVREQVDAKAKARREAGLAPPPSVILVYADESMSYGQLLPYIRTVMDTHPTVYVFMEVKRD